MPIWEDRSRLFAHAESAVAPIRIELMGRDRIFNFVSANSLASSSSGTYYVASKQPLFFSSRQSLSVHPLVASCRYGRLPPRPRPMFLTGGSLKHDVVGYLSSWDAPLLSSWRFLLRP